MISIKKENNSIVFRFFNIKLTIKNKNYFSKIFTPIAIKFKLFNVKKKNYKYIVPMGVNCTYSLKFRKHYDFVESYMFNYADIRNQDKYIEALYDIDNIFPNNFEFYEPRTMWLNTKYDILFHGRSAEKDLMDENGNHIEDKVKKDFEELVERMKYLLQKTKDTFNTKEKKLFVYCYQNIKDEETANFSQKLYKYLSEKSENFDFLIIICSYKTFPDINKMQEDYENVYVRQVFPQTEDYDWAKTMEEFAPEILKGNDGKKLKCD